MAELKQLSGFHGDELIKKVYRLSKAHCKVEVSRVEPRIGYGWKRRVSVKDKDIVSAYRNIGITWNW